MGLLKKLREARPPAASEPPSSRAEVLPGNGTSSSATETLSHTKAVPDLQELRPCPVERLG